MESAEGIGGRKWSLERHGLNAEPVEIMEGKHQIATIHSSGDMNLLVTAPELWEASNEMLKLFNGPRMPKGEQIDKAVKQLRDGREERREDGLARHPARLMQPSLLPHDHSSLQPHRLKKFERVNPERIYAAAWKQSNRRSPGVNEGFTLIEWILCPSGSRYPLPVSRRDAAVAASVIQWLGTNCGLGLIRECERKINEAREGGYLDEPEKERRAISFRRRLR